MDERDMEEEGKNRKGKGWRINKHVFFLVFIFLELLFMFKEKCNQESESPWGKIKYIYTG
jgi:hypothetical protein